MSYKDKRVGRNVPMFMRSQVSDSFLRNNPIYKNIFHKCPKCNRFSLKPNIAPSMLTPETAKNVKKRTCTLCGYIHDTEASTVYGWS